MLSPEKWLLEGTQTIKEISSHTTIQHNIKYFSPEKKDVHNVFLTKSSSAACRISDRGVVSGTPNPKCRDTDRKTGNRGHKEVISCMFQKAVLLCKEQRWIDLSLLFLFGHEDQPLAVSYEHLESEMHSTANLFQDAVEGGASNEVIGALFALKFPKEGVHEQYSGENKRSYNKQQLPSVRFADFSQSNRSPLKRSEQRMQEFAEAKKLQALHTIRKLFVFSPTSSASTSAKIAVARLMALALILAPETLPRDSSLFTSVNALVNILNAVEDGTRELSVPRCSDRLLTSCHTDKGEIILSTGNVDELPCVEVELADKFVCNRMAVLVKQNQEPKQNEDIEIETTKSTFSRTCKAGETVYNDEDKSEERDIGHGGYSPCLNFAECTASLITSLALLFQSVLVSSTVLCHSVFDDVGSMVKDGIAEDPDAEMSEVQSCDNRLAQSSIEMAKEFTREMHDLSKFIAIGTREAATRALFDLGRQWRKKKLGKKLMPFRIGRHATYATCKIALAALGAAFIVTDTVFEAAMAVGKKGADVTAEVVRHKYGTAAGKVVEGTSESVDNSVRAIRFIAMLQPVALTKTIAKNTGRVMIPGEVDKSKTLNRPQSLVIIEKAFEDLMSPKKGTQNAV